MAWMSRRFASGMKQHNSFTMTDGCKERDICGVVKLDWTPQMQTAWGPGTELFVSEEYVQCFDVC
jgi:hypothetical protein